LGAIADFAIFPNCSHTSKFDGPAFDGIDGIAAERAPPLVGGGGGGAASTTDGSVGIHVSAVTASAPAARFAASIALAAFRAFELAMIFSSMDGTTPPTTESPP
jgi:hypothetical protein